MKEVAGGIKPTETHKGAQYSELDKAKAHVEVYKARVAAMTPQEREARAKRDEEKQREWDFYTTPEGKIEAAAFLVRSMKKQGKLPPDLDHLWFCFPSGWVEYREHPDRKEGEAPYTATFGRTPTQEEWDEYYPALQKKLKAWRRLTKARENGEEVQIDPLTGDILEPDEFPLHAESEYTFDGKTRVRSFVHPKARSVLSPDSPLLNHRKKLQTDGKEEPESESNARLVKRLLKAGFVEVEPTLKDKASFEGTQWYRSLSPSEKLAYLQECMREMRGEESLAREALETAGDKFTKFIEFLIDFLIALFAPAGWEEQRKDKKTA